MAGGGFSSSASVCPTDQITILQAIVDKLRTDIGDVFGSESTCFVSDAAWPGVEVQDEVFCTVHPADANFELDDPIGAGEFGIIENGVFQVTVWSKIQLDRIEHNVTELTDSTRGLLALKQKVLASLAGKQIYSDAPANSVPLLVAVLRPMNTIHHPSRQGEGDFSSFSIVFLGPFYWNLQIN